MQTPASTPQRTDFWTDYVQKGAQSPARPRVLKTLDLFCSEPGTALDLGCGSGRDTRELLARGWTVVAVDSSQSEVSLTRDLSTSPGRLTVTCGSFPGVDFGADRFDLVNASYSLPFCEPAQFQNLWQELLRALKPGGVISCDLFGERDEWHTEKYSRMSFHSQLKVDELPADGPQASCQRRTSQSLTTPKVGTGHSFGIPIGKYRSCG